MSFRSADGDTELEPLRSQGRGELSKISTFWKLHADRSRRDFVAEADLNFWADAAIGSTLPRVDHRPGAVRPNGRHFKRSPYVYGWRGAFDVKSR